MTRAHAFGKILTQLRARVPGLTQARLAALAGYDPAVITRMAQGGQDLTGPQARDRVLQVIRALHAAGALRGVDDANALLTAANLSPLISAASLEAALIQQLSLHGSIGAAAGAPRHGGPTMDDLDTVVLQLRADARAWDSADDDAERAVALAAAGALAAQHGQSRLGMRLLARAALDEVAVAVSRSVLQADYQRHLAAARAQLDDSALANAWLAGQLLTLAEVGHWLAVLPTLVGQKMGET